MEDRVPFDAAEVQGTLPTGGTAGQILSKIDGTNYNTTWIDNFAPNVELYVKNQSGSAMTKGQVVYVAGVDNAGDTPRVALADADAEATSSKTIGRLKQDLADGAFGYVVTEGIIEGLNTAAATAGQSIWLSGTAGGVVYGAPPAKPAHSVYLGVVIRAQTNNGKVYVKVQNGFEINELHDVNIDSGTLAGGQVIKYNASSSMWVNGAAAGGVTANDTAPSLSTAAAGDAWFDTNDGTLYVCYVDVDSTKQWVQVQANSALEGSILSRLSSLEGSAAAFGNLSPNYFINADMSIWQRGTSVTLGASQPFGADRWRYTTNRYGPAGMVISQQTFTPGSYPVPGVQSYARFYQSSYNYDAGDYSEIAQRIEDVTLFAGKTITVSFWANYPAASRNINVVMSYGNVTGVTGTTNTLTSSTGWTKYTTSFTVSSFSGATISANNYLEIGIRYFAPAAATVTIDMTALQLEVGNTATAFRRNQSNKQAELAACQRYYWRTTATAANTVPVIGMGTASTTTTISFQIPFPVEMRDVPTSYDWTGTLSNYQWAQVGLSSGALATTNPTIGTSSTKMLGLNCTSTGLTASYAYHFRLGAAGVYFGVSAEL